MQRMYHYLLPRPFQHYISSTEINFLGLQDSEFRDGLTTKWVKDYCDAKSIPLILPIQPHSSVRAVTHSTIREETPSVDVVACSGVYLLEVLDGVNHFRKALKALQNISYYKNKPTKDSDAALIVHQKLYEQHILYAKGKCNFLGLYLYIYDSLSKDLADKSILECKMVLEEFEQRDFSWMTAMFDSPAFLYVAELYYRFCVTLLGKIITQEQALQNEEASLNQDQKQREEFIIASGYHLIHHCIREAYSALNRFKRGYHHIDQFTKVTMDRFTINMSGSSALDSAGKLRIALDVLYKNVIDKIMPVNYFGFFSPGVVDVDLRRLPWHDRLAAPQTPVNLIVNNEPELPPPSPCKEASSLQNEELVAETEIVIPSTEVPPLPPPRSCSLKKRKSGSGKYRRRSNKKLHLI